MLIEGTGTTACGFLSTGKHIIINTKYYYVSSAKVIFISPQQLFNKKKGVTGEFTYREDNSTLIFADLPALDIDYDSRIHLPIDSALNTTTMALQMILCITTESNQNLNRAQRLLL